jgi:hypothetical protein
MEKYHNVEKLNIKIAIKNMIKNLREKLRKFSILPIY